MWKARGLPPSAPVVVLMGTLAKALPLTTLPCAYAKTREPVNEPTIVVSLITVATRRSEHGKEPAAWLHKSVRIATVMGMHYGYFTGVVFGSRKYMPLPALLKQVGMNQGSRRPLSVAILAAACT